MSDVLATDNNQGTVTRVQWTAAKVAGAITAGTILVLFPIIALLQTKIFSDASMIQNIDRLINNEFLFRLSIVTDTLMYLSVVVLGWAFYVMLRPVSRSYAMLGLVLRTVEAMVGMLGVMAGITILILLTNNDFSSSYSSVQAAGAISVLRDFQDAVNKIIPVFLSTGAVTFYLLFRKTNYIPRFLANAGVVAYSLVFANAMLTLLVPDFARLVALPLALPVVAFEFTIGIWLFTKGLRGRRVASVKS